MFHVCFPTTQPGETSSWCAKDTPAVHLQVGSVGRPTGRCLLVMIQYFTGGYAATRIARSDPGMELSENRLPQIRVVYHLLNSYTATFLSFYIGILCGKAIINHPDFDGLYNVYTTMLTTHLWKHGGWFTSALPTLFIIISSF